MQQAELQVSTDHEAAPDDGGFKSMNKNQDERQFTTWVFGHGH
jgi:hypothetical protein